MIYADYYGSYLTVITRPPWVLGLQSYHITWTITRAQLVKMYIVYWFHSQISKLPNGATVATLENLSPVSRVAVMYNAGSRFESRDNAGVTHSIRSCSNLVSEFRVSPCE